MSIHLAKDEHCLFAGRTRSGKTTVAQAYAAGEPNVFMLDTKGVEDFGKWTDPKEVELVERLEDLPAIQKTKVIYRPVAEELSIEFYDSFYNFAYEWGQKNGGCVVWTDELMSVSPNANVMPQGLKRIMTRGAKLGVRHWGLTQRPSGIPLVCISESSNFFVFDLNLEDDRKRLVKISGCTELMERPPKHHFWYYHIANDQAALCRLKM